MRFWSALTLILTLKCEESTRLMSESLDRDLTRSERIAVRMHALVCKTCRRFRRHLRFLNEALRQRLEERTPDLSHLNLSADARDRIHHALEAESGENPPDSL